MEKLEKLPGLRLLISNCRKSAMRVPVEVLEDSVDIVDVLDVTTEVESVEVLDVAVEEVIVDVLEV